MGMHAFKVSEHHVSVERVPMLDLSVLDHGVCHGLLVVANEVAPAAWTRLVERHVGHARSGREIGT
jgi:hypothetical protein